MSEISLLAPTEVESLSRLDRAFASFLSNRTTLENSGKQVLESLLAMLSLKLHQGHSCIEIDESEKSLLLASRLVAEFPRQPPHAYPLVIEQNRLYLQRYWHYEDRLAKQIKELARINNPIANLDIFLDHYFPVTTTQTNWQREAARLAAQRAFCIITGGPGTGKTTTICKILALCQKLVQELNNEPLLIALAAPTGKAAARLQEAIALNLADLACTDSIKEHIPRSAITLHRLLGAKPPSPYFKHDASNPLVFDLVVVDEASMVDLALMSKLVDALKPGARLILLGDKDQLASVESGAVLSDLIAALPGNTVELKQTFRFDETIKKLAEAVNAQDHETAWRILSAGADNAQLLAQPQLISYILKRRADYVSLVKSNAEFITVHQAFTSFQVLCANRHGKNGALAINAGVERALFGDSLNYGTAWYPGRPVMVLQNNPALHLYNGDIGICLPDKDQNGNLMVFFQKPDGAVKKYLPARMPSCETVFAMTIHKSQGSEFDEALIVLPDTINPVLSKELLYTAITRAKKMIKIVSVQSVFTATINKKIARNTGLTDKLQ